MAKESHLPRMNVFNKWSHNLISHPNPILKVKLLNYNYLTICESTLTLFSCFSIENTFQICQMMWFLCSKSSNGFSFHLSLKFCKWCTRYFIIWAWFFLSLLSSFSVSLTAPQACQHSPTWVFALLFALPTMFPPDIPMVCSSFSSGLSSHATLGGVLHSSFYSKYWYLHCLPLYPPPRDSLSFLTFFLIPHQIYCYLIYYIFVYKLSFLIRI